jgi:hypothetical protein
VGEWKAPSALPNHWPEIAATNSLSLTTHLSHPLAIRRLGVPIVGGRYLGLGMVANRIDTSSSRLTYLHWCSLASRW